MYRLTVKAPRSVDPTEATTLTPAAGAPHSDSFVVATSASIGGAKPYLHAIDGQTGNVDPISKRTTVGSRSITLRDQRLTAATPGLVRWVTAFLGDATARLQLKGCKAILEESLNGGGAWTTIFTGRIGDVKLDGKLKYVFEIKSSVEDLKKQIFVFDPLPTASYAFRAALFPPRLPRSWGQGTLPAGNWIPALVSGKFTGTDGVVRANLDFQLSSEDLKSATLVTKQSLAVSAGLAPALVYLKVTAGGATGVFRVTKHTLAYVRYNEGSIADRRYLTRIGPMEELPASHPLHLALPANGTAVTCYVQAIDTAPVTKMLPLFIDDVHPIQLWADILDGKFSIPDQATFAARPLAPRDTSGGGPWDYANNSLADLPKVRFIITKPEKAADWIVANICQPFNLAYRVDGLGRIVPIDLRLTSSTATTGTVVDADLVELPTDWGLDGSQALFGANVSYYVDAPKQGVNLRASPDSFPDMNAALVDSTQQPWLVINPLATARDAGDTITSIDAQGIRMTLNEFLGGASTLAQLDKLSKVTAAMYDLLAPFAGGSIGDTLKAKRGSTFGTSGQVGQLWTVTVSTIPDPATNQRGGARVMLILSRTEQNLAVLFRVLDLGSATVAGTPTIGVLAITNGGLDVPITVNAAGDPVQVEYIITAPGTGSRPAASDPGWRLISESQHLLLLTGTHRQQGVPSNTRLWVRARSRPMGNSQKLPSAYVFPAGGSPAGSIDVAAITAPSAVGSSGLSGNRATVSWTNGDATKVVEIFLNSGGIPGGGWTDAMRVQPTLPAGSTTVELRNLNVSTTYGVAVRHRDDFGGTSAFATATFTTTGTRKTALLTPPIGIGGGGGTVGVGIDLAPIVITPRIDVPVGVSLLLNSSDPAYDFEIQHAPDSGGSPNVGAATTIGLNVPGTQRVYHDPQPLDGALHWYRHRHVGYGDTAGAWSDWKSATPSIQRLDGPTNSLATPLNSQSRFRCKARKSATQTLTSGTLTSIAWDVEDFDIGGLHDNASNNNRITIPTGGDSGLWLLICNFEFLSNATAGLRQVQIRDNSGNILGAWQDPNNAGGNIQGQLFAVVDSPAVGTWFEVKAAQISGVNQSFNGGGLVPNFQALHDW